MQTSLSAEEHVCISPEICKRIQGAGDSETCANLDICTSGDRQICKSVPARESREESRQ